MLIGGRELPGGFLNMIEEILELDFAELSAIVAGIDVTGIGTAVVVADRVVNDPTGVYVDGILPPPPPISGT